MVGGACDTITEVTSEASLRWTGRCDGLRRTLKWIGLLTTSQFYFYSV
jgi:hypothetical protein